MEYLLTVFYAFVFLLIILKSSFFKSEKISSKYFGYVFILKIFAGILLGYLYQIYFNGGDTYIFFNDANKMFAMGKSHPADFFRMLFGLGDRHSLEGYYKQLSGWNNYEYFYNDSKTIIRINAAIRIFTFGFYNVHVVFFSFLSLIGLNGLFKIFSRFFPEKEKELFAAVLLLPSVLFWTSGILKEGILVFALGMFLYSFTKLIPAKSVKHVLLFGVGLLLLVYLKIYTLMMIIPGMIAYWWSVKTNYKNVLLKFSVTYIVYFIFLFNLKYINPNYNLAEIIYWKQHNSIGYAKFMNSGSFVEPPLLKEPTIKSIVKNSPHALANTFILPNWNHVHNPFAMTAAIENLLIILIIILTIIFSKRLSDHQKPVFYLSLFFVVFLFTLIGLTTPLIGSMVRYKVPALPFLLSMLVMILNKEKISRLLSR